MLKKLLLITASTIILSACNHGVKVDRDYSNGINMAMPDKVYFDFESAKLTKHAMFDLDKYATKYHKSHYRSLTLFAHGDKRGDDKYNMTLTHHRAEAVKHYLHKKGVKMKMMLVEQGKDFITYTGECEKALKENRVVNILPVNGTYKTNQY